VLGVYPNANPVTAHQSDGDLTATNFSRWRFDPSTNIHDSLGRPRRISDDQPIHEHFDSV
jgi:hypothetical protein